MNYLLALLRFAHILYPAAGDPGTFHARQDTIGPSVTLDYGTFHGLRNESTGIISFRGVRFADPPTGDLRWRAPVMPPTKHLGTVDATQFRNMCIQTVQKAVKPGTSEDCLFGNVYIPIGTHALDKLPVMVWFHGGGFQLGSTHDAPPELIIHSSAKPLIFVSFEYRLGQFGFLGGSDVKANGALNAGLLDQRAALRWVKRYIHQFGGDSSQVTIWGQSAGAGSTMFQLIANGGNNEGLFRGAIGDSPSLSFTPASDGAYAQEIYKQFANFAGCSNQGSNTLVCLRSASTGKLASAGSQTILTRPATLYVFAPTLDGNFLKQRPVEAFKSGYFAHVPILFGSNTDEGSIWSRFISDPSANISKPNANETTVFNFLHGQYPTLTRPTVDKAFQLYPLRDYNNSINLQGQHMYGEARYICTAGLITGSASSSTQAFQYHYDNPHLGSFHSADLEAFFAPPSNADKNDLALFEAMREYFTSFVISGRPVAKNGVAWNPVGGSTGSPRMLLHPGNIRMETVSDALSARCSFWHGVSGETQT